VKRGLGSPDGNCLGRDGLAGVLKVGYVANVCGCGLRILAGVGTRRFRGVRSSVTTGAARLFESTARACFFSPNDDVLDDTVLRCDFVDDVSLAEEVPAEVTFPVLLARPGVAERLVLLKSAMI
jgi:hypothetical protein